MAMVRLIFPRVLAQFMLGHAKSQKDFFYYAANTALQRAGACVLEAQPAEIDLAFVDSSRQFDTGHGHSRGPEPLEAEHRADPQLHPAVILLVQ
jgi:hypothetical protein